jgi:cytochrome P450
MVDVTTPGLYLDGIPHERFAAMRANPELTWHPYGDDGFWAVTRHGDVNDVSRAVDVYSSGVGHTNLWDLEADALEARRSIIDSDAPDHRRLRRLVSKAFSPASVRRFETITRDITADLLDDFVANGGGDWVEQVAAPLPIRVILSVLGVPIDDGEYLVELSNYLVEGTSDKTTLAPDAYGNQTPLRLLPFASPASHALFEYGEALERERREEPRDDVMTLLAKAHRDQNKMSDAEFRNMFHVLIFAGNETTRTAMSHGAIALADRPEVWAALSADLSLVDTAVEEILRWSTPVLHMRRTATRDTELSGTQITAGDKVVMWYASSNFDPSAFESPTEFDITRAKNPQYSFGGTGPHFCLGAYLARMEIRILLEEMAKRSMVLKRTSEPARVASNFVNGVQSVEMSLA